MVEFSAENKEKFEKLLTRYPNKQAALLPTLWLVQEQFGHIEGEHMEYVAGLLDISPVHVYSVATFYTMYNLKPIGRHHIQVCRTLSCALMGAESLVDCLKDKLGIEIGQTTQDGKFTLSEVECLASCGTAPMMMINEKYYENLSRDKVEEILNKLD